MAGVTIIGAGAVGGITGAHLTLAGVDVVLADTWKEHVEAVRREVFIDGVRGEYKTPLNAVLPGDLKGPLDIVFLAVKSGATLQALESVRKLLSPESVVVSLQNSVNLYGIAGLIGPEKTIGCVVGWGATSVGPGRLTQTSPGNFTVGCLDANKGKRIGEVADLLNIVTNTQITDNIIGHLWSKLYNNCVIALGALIGKTVRETVAPERNKKIILKIIEEGLKVALARGIRLEKYEGIVDMQLFVPKNREEEETAFRLIDLLGQKHGDIYPGALQDFEKGRKSEIEYINGYVEAEGKEVGVPTPVNSAVVKMFTEIEEGKRKISGSNMEELAGIANVS